MNIFYQLMLHKIFFNKSDLENILRKFDIYFEKCKRDTEEVDPITRRLIIRNATAEIVQKINCMAEKNSKFDPFLRKLKHRIKKKILTKYVDNYLEKRLRDIF